MWKLHLESMDNLDKQFLDSFDRLEETDHLDGKYRLRKYSVVKKVEGFHGNNYIKMPDRTFNQSSEYNEHQGGVERAFEPIEDGAIYGHTVQDCLARFASACEIPDGIEIEIHQMRVLATDEGQLSPEGVHQDGYDRIMMMGVRRSNITGGDMLLYRTKTGDPVVNMTLEDGEYAILNDRVMWHNGSKPEKINPDQEGFMDFIVFLAKFQPTQ